MQQPLMAPPDPYTDNQLKSINNVHNNIQMLGYDPEKYLFVTLIPQDKEYKKIYTYTKKKIDNWRDSEYDQYYYQLNRSMYSLDETFADQKFIIHIGIGNIMNQFIGTSSNIIAILVEKTTGTLKLIREFIEHICCQYDNQQDTEKKIIVFDPTVGPPREVLGRPLQTVYISKVIRQQIVDNISHFLSNQTFKYYYKHGMPHKLVYLLYGLPGTGKTSLIKAIATHFNLAIMPLKLNSLDEQALRHTLSVIPKDSIIVLEDFDSAFTSMNDVAVKNIDINPHSGSKLAFSAILDLLDGLSSPEKQIIIMTCNNTQIMNSPYMRAGRIDKVVSFGPLITETASDMLTDFYPEIANQPKIMELASKINGKLTPAELQTLIHESKDFENINVKISDKINEIKNRYSQLNQQNQQMYQNYYQGSYQGYQSCDRMYM